MTAWERDLEWCAKAAAKVRAKHRKNRSQAYLTRRPKVKIAESDARLIQAMRNILHYKIVAQLFNIHPDTVYTVWSRNLDG